MNTNARLNAPSSEKLFFFYRHFWFCCGCTLEGEVVKRDAYLLDFLHPLIRGLKGCLRFVLSTVVVCIYGLGIFYLLSSSVYI